MWRWWWRSAWTSKWKKKKARYAARSFCSITARKADQSAFDLPHLVTGTRSVMGRTLEVRLIGIMGHMKPNKLHLYTMTKKYETRANYTVQGIYRFLIDCPFRLFSPSTLFIQMDNCTRENENRYFSHKLNFLSLVIFSGILKCSFSQWTILTRTLTRHFPYLREAAK